LLSTVFLYQSLSTIRGVGDGMEWGSPHATFDFGRRGIWG
jgi:hypothetical protein